MNRIVLFPLSFLTLAVLTCVVPSAVAAAPATQLGEQPTNPSGIIASAVMAKAVTAANLDPIDVTDTFPADQSVFHVVIGIVNAPKDTAVKVIWLTGNDQNMGEYEMKSDGTRNLDYWFKPNAGKLPAGQYKVQIFVNGTLDRTVNYTVSSTPSTQATHPSQPQQSGIVSEVVIAEDTKGEEKEPVNPTTTFHPTSIIHAVVRIQNAPASTTFKAVWYVVDAGNSASPNTLIDQTELTTDGTRNLDFTLKPSTQWPPGSYRVEIYVNGTLDTVKEYSVK